jgi:hypothetical protein
MDIRLLTHQPEAGWSSPLPADLDSARTLVAVFAATAYADQPDFWAALRDAFPHSHVLACSSAGAIAGDHVGDESAALAVARFDRVALASAAVPIQALEMSKRAGEKLGRALASAHPDVVLVVCDGLHVNASELVQGLAAALPPRVQIAGGLAGDADRFARTWTLVDGVPRSGWVSAIALSGPVDIRTASRSGWEPFGPDRRITRAERNVLYELDGRPALQIYKDYLGELASGLPATALLFPLAVRRDGTQVDGIVRTVLGVDEDAQSMTFAGDIPQGGQARLMRAGHDRLIEGAALAGCEAAPPDGGPVLALAVSCVGRRLVLGESAEEETAATLAALPPGSTQVGFYAYGEISPSTSATCELHNQTMTLTTLRERAA